MVFGPEAVAQVNEAVVRHLHQLVAEVGLSSDEWAAAIAFLTAVGQTCDDVPQEFILLSDTLGVSSLAEMVNYPAAPGATENAALGPFSCPAPPDAVQDPGGQHADNLRGIFHTDGEGRFELRAVRPTVYSIPHDGAVGQMLAATGRHPMRADHLHLRVTAAGNRELITHLFDAESANPTPTPCSESVIPSWCHSGWTMPASCRRPSTSSCKWHRFPGWHRLPAL